MTTTTNLGITLIDTNQSQKEVTHNEGFEKFDSILTESVDVEIDDGTNTVSSATTLSAARLKLTPGTVSAAFDVELPAIKRELIITNKTTYDAHVICAGAAPGASEAIVEPASTAKIYCDAAEVVATAGGTNPSGAFVFTDLLDAPNAFTGAARKHVAVNAAETGLEFVESDFAIVEKSADYTLTLDDTGKLVAMNDVGPLTLTVPPQSDEAWTTGTIIYAMQLGAGQVTVAAGSGVTIMSPASMKTRAQYSEVKLTCVDTDLWTLTGDLEGSVGTSSFVGQTDTPASYTGAGGKLLAVNSGATAVEFKAAREFPLEINAQSGTTYTLALTDAGKLVTCDNGSAITVTVPDNTDEAFPVGTQILIAQIGAGQVTVAEDTSVTIITPETLLLRKQGAQAALVKIATDTWLLEGNLEAA